MKNNIQEIINESIADEVRKAIINENESGGWFIMCDGEPVENFDSDEAANKELTIYKDRYPNKDVSVEKVNYNTPMDMFGKLDDLGEKLDQKENTPMKKIKVDNMEQAYLDAKERGLNEITINGKTHTMEDLKEEINEGKKCVCKTCNEECSANEGEECVCENCKGNDISEDEDCNECKKSKTIKLTEEAMVNLISKLVKESVPGVVVTKKAQGMSGKQSTDHLKDVENKLKKSATIPGNDNPEFPNAVGKGEVEDNKNTKINATDEQDEEIMDNRGNTMADLDYDYDPAETFKERAKMALEGDPKMGNSQEYANAIKSDTGKNIYDSIARKKEKRAKGKDAFWGAKGVQPLDVKTVNESEEITEEKSVVISEEVERMKTIFNYDDKTQ